MSIQPSTNIPSRIIEESNENTLDNNLIYKPTPLKKENVGGITLIAYMSVVIITCIAMTLINKESDDEIIHNNMSNNKTMHIAFLMIQVIGFIIYLGVLSKYNDIQFGAKLYLSLSVIFVFIFFYIVVIFMYAGPLLFTITKMVFSNSSEKKDNNIGLFYYVIKDTTLRVVYYLDLILVIFMFAFFFYKFANLLV
tara:strand:+ start:502 stop:1086 length:585 start_codon:yes stop_codon:yes gene_type:complete